MREEIFGPVLCVLPYTTDDDAVDLADNSPYGLSGAVVSSDIPRAEAIAGRLRTGTVGINGGQWYRTGRAVRRIQTKRAGSRIGYRRI